MSAEYSEDKLVQETAAVFMKDELGWDSVFAYNAEDFGPTSLLGRSSEKEVVLRRDLRDALERLNPGHSEEVYQQGIDALPALDVSKSTVLVNRELYVLVRDGVPVSYRDAEGQMRHPRLRVVDFDKAENNRFLTVWELWVQNGIYRRGRDIVGFVNGLPLLFVELKGNHEDVKVAFEDNALVMLSNGDESRGAVNIAGCCLLAMVYFCIERVPDIFCEPKLLCELMSSLPAQLEHTAAHRLDYEAREPRLTAGQHPQLEFISFSNSHRDPLFHAHASSEMQDRPDHCLPNVPERVCHHFGLFQRLHVLSNAITELATTTLGVVRNVVNNPDRGAVQKKPVFSLFCASIPVLSERHPCFVPRHRPSPPGVRGIPVRHECSMLEVIGAVQREMHLFLPDDAFVC